MSHGIADQLVTFLAASLVVLGTASGCGASATEPPVPTPDPPRPTTVTVSPATAELAALGATVQLTAEVRDQSGQIMAGTAVSWSSAAGSVATVDASGLVRGAGEGVTTITASSGTVGGTASVTVSQAPDSVAVSPAEATIAALGDTVRLAAEAFDANRHAMASAEFSWESSAASVAMVDAAGLVTAVANGTATITAAAAAASGTAIVVVKQSAGSVTVSPTADTIAVGDTLRLAAEAVDANGQRVEDAEFTWASSDESVATVDTSGLVRGIAESTASITATAGSAQGTARITVTNPHYAPPFRGTAYLDPDVIIPSDPTDFVGLEPAGRGERFVYDRRHGWVTVRAYLFDATFANALSAEFQVNPEFGSWTEAEAAARAYAPAIGQMPFALRENVEAVWIHRGDEPFGGGNRALTVHTDRGEQYRQRGVLPEILVHEGVHASLDAAHANAPGWLAAQAADPTFISTYARDYPGREDLAESFSAWLAVRHRRDRITEGMADTITSAIPHRLAYFDSLDLNLCPIVAGGACEARAHWTLSGTVSHGWSNPLASGLDTAMAGDISGAVVEVIEGADAGRRAVTDDRGRYRLEALEKGQLTIRATAEGFAPADRNLGLTSDTAFSFAMSRALPPPGPAATFPDTDPDYLQALKSDYPYVHQVANVRVFSDISPTFSEDHAEHLSRVWDFFDALYAENRGAHIDVYYTSDSTVFQKVVPHCPTIFIPGARNVTTCYLDYPRWFIIPYQIPDLGTQLHEVGHDFLYATWPQAWRTANWFVEGTAMYYEGGVFTDDGSLRVQTPLPYCTDLFQRYDQEGRLMPLGGTGPSQSRCLSCRQPTHLFPVVYALPLRGAIRTGRSVYADPAHQHRPDSHQRPADCRTPRTDREVRQRA